MEKVTLLITLLVMMYITDADKLSVEKLGTIIIIIFVLITGILIINRIDRLEK